MNSRMLASTRWCTLTTLPYIQFKAQFKAFMTTFSNLCDHCYVMHYPRYVLLSTRLNHVLLTLPGSLGHDTKCLAVLHKQLLGQWLRQYISWIVRCRYWNKSHLLSPNLLSNMVENNLYVLCPCSRYRILNQTLSCSVVNPYWYTSCC